MKTLLGSYFDGDASRLALLLDPTRMNSPLHQFRAEVSQGFAKLNVPYMQHILPPETWNA